MHAVMVGLCMTMSSYTAGVVIPVDGGLMARKRLGDRV